jgi:ubiquinone/menaquinone biosynthesis C-methylase UbiE
MLVKQLMSIINRNMIVKQVDTIQNILGTDGMIPAGCVFVCEEKKLIGILTDGDLRRQLITLSDNTTVGKMMAHSPKFVSESTLVSEAFTLMTQSAINQLPVLNDDHHIVGYLNYHTLANQLSPEQLFIDLQSSQLSENEQRHLSRYHFASQFIQPQLQVLDCACGSGYGSKILTDMGMQVTGVDLCQQAIDHAKEKYKSSNITFQCQDINHLDFADECFDAVVTLETLEHVTNEVCRQFIKKIDNMLKPGGLLIASSPMLRFKNKQPYITNPYHINELPRQELLNMFNSLLPGYVLHFYHQKDTRFVPLGSEHTGFCILVARKSDKGC